MEIVGGPRLDLKHGASISEDMKCSGVDCQGGQEVTYDGSCGAGCCSYYVCRLCGERFKVEWPD